MLRLEGVGSLALKVKFTFKVKLPGRYDVLACGRRAASLVLQPATRGYIQAAGCRTSDAARE